MAQGVNMASINAKIQRAVDDALANEVANDVKQKLSDSVVSVVYSAGNPIQYRRRGVHDGSGGLGDKETMNSFVSGGVLTVSPQAKPKRGREFGEGTLGYNINYGYAREFDPLTWYNSPRPFVPAARKDIESTGSHIIALATGVQARLGFMPNVIVNAPYSGILKQ